MLFHHRVATEGDAYRLWTMYSFDCRAGVERYTEALQAVIDRHDILRTGVVWDGLQEPVQVVWRKALVIVDELELDASNGAITQQLVARFDAGEFQLKLQQAPLRRLIVARDEAHDRFVVMEVSHHIAMDHISQEVIQRELRARLLGLWEALPDPLPFRNFIAQVRMSIARGEHETFFTEMLETVDEPTAPYGLMNVQGDGRGIAEAQREIEPELANGLRRTAQSLGVSPAALHHLAWALVLARLTGRADVVFGTVLSGRLHGGAAAQRVVGMCANTLPIRIAIDERGCRDAVRATHHVLMRLMYHEQAPLALAQRCSGVEAPTPLFTTILNYRHSEPELVGKGKAQRYSAVDAMPGMEFLGAEERTNFPFTMSVDDLGREVRLIAQVDSLVDPQRICSLMYTALEKLVGALEREPASALRNLDVLPSEERRQLVVQWNETTVDFPRKMCIHELFEVQAAQSPGAEAVVYGAETLSYDGLNQRANRLAQHLRDLGVGPEQRVAICVERSLDMVVGVIAILKAGGCYVPLDPAYPLERLEYMLRDCEPMALLTHQKVKESVRTPLRSVARQRAMRVVDLEADGEKWANRSKENLSRDATGLTPKHLAYVIYTSGSTGRPKGVEVEHQNVVNFILWAMKVFSPEQLSHTLFSTSMNFDPSIYECFVPLAMGASTIVVDDLLSCPSEGAEVSLINAVPSAMATLLDSTGIPQSTRTVTLGGEVLSRALVERIFEESDVQRVGNAYGPTETFYATYVATEKEEDFAEHIGRPIWNTQVYILDASGQPVPIGVAGEIFVGGHGVARGYGKRPGLTAERFLPDPFSSSPGSRMYKTGDLGRYLENGNIEFLGRNDSQVKHRGFRIELGEIEAKLAEHPTVRQAAVLMREDRPGEKRLVAYVVAAPGGTDGFVEKPWPAEVLRDYLANFLPKHMVPAAYVELARLPLTQNGKLDRKALPEPEGAAYSRRDYEPPVGETENRLAGIWADVLRVERVGRRDDFFELGGHSLLAMTVLARLRTGLGVDIALSDLLARPVLCDFALEVRRTAGSHQQE